MCDLTTGWILESAQSLSVCTYHITWIRRRSMTALGSGELIPQNERELRRPEGSGLLIGDPLSIYLFYLSICQWLEDDGLLMFVCCQTRDGAKEDEAPNVFIFSRHRKKTIFHKFCVPLILQFRASVESVICEKNVCLFYSVGGNKLPSYPPFCMYLQMAEQLLC